ncbi:MAG: MarR family transcriptional regulator [Gammaproteobacteria bacterium]|nr:MarR family transcriptional regulator [Gammaproteobacteria bacterium]
MSTATPIEERFASALHAAARAWRQALDRRLRHLGISQAGWPAVTVTAKSKTPLSQTELADKLGVEGATMVAMIDRLVKAQLVTREPSTTDRRVKYVALTEAGTRLYTKVRAEAEAFRREILAHVDSARLVAATELLEELLKVVEAQR